MESQTDALEPSASSPQESSSHASSHSTTPNSTSTYRYSHEPFSTFQHKVKTLASETGAVSFENVKRLPGGSFNRIVSITVTWFETGKECSCDVEAVLRIPRFSNDQHIPEREIQDQAAVLDVVATAGLPAPAILAFDATSRNAINSPYSLQTFVKGKPLDLIYSDMSHQEKVSVASELVDILARMEKIRFPASGRLVCGTSAVNQTKVPLGTTIWQESLERVEVRSFGVGPASSRIDTRLTSTLPELFTEQLDAWLVYEKSKNPDSLTVDLFVQLKIIFQEMVNLGIFPSARDATDSSEDKHSILYHWDLEPRNILVERRTTAQPDKHKSWHICGILDWDDSLCVPPILTRKPPVWLWDFSDDETFSSSILRDYDGDVDLLPPELYEGSGIRISAEDLQLKKHFETVFADIMYSRYGSRQRQIYHDDAYGRGRWLRRLWRFALDGFSDAQHLDRFNKFNKDWCEYKLMMTKEQSFPLPSISTQRRKRSYQ